MFAFNAFSVGNADNKTIFLRRLRKKYSLIHPELNIQEIFPEGFANSITKKKKKQKKKTECISTNLFIKFVIL